MRKLPAVEEARAIMRQGMDWGVWKWLTEKKRVRETADHARAALVELEKKVKGAWTPDLKSAYNQLVLENGNGRDRGRARAGNHGPMDADLLAEIRQVIAADDKAYSAHDEMRKKFSLKPKPA